MGVKTPGKSCRPHLWFGLKHLSDFLHREEGAQDVINFKFDGNLTCDEPAPPIMATKLGAFTYNDFDGPTQHIPAKDEVERIVKVCKHFAPIVYRVTHLLDKNLPLTWFRQFRQQVGRYW